MRRGRVERRVERIMVVVMGVQKEGGWRVGETVLDDIFLRICTNLLLFYRCDLFLSSFLLNLAATTSPFHRMSLIRPIP
jgi:hypothetical protein